MAVRGTGIVLSTNPPSNNIPEIDKNKPEVYFFGIWQGLDEGLNVTYNGYCALGLSCNNPGTTIYKFPAPNLSFHKVRLIYSGNVYIVYVDDKKVFTSPLSLNRPKYIWLGNPTNQGFNDYWTAFRVDYIKVKQLFPETFLDLPWDYEKKGLSFNEAALSINSYFDHEYPLLSAGINEPRDSLETIIDFQDPIRKKEFYSSHDGYDYGKPASANLGDDVLAAAPGWATYKDDCTACGNAILIDHGNGYQTRYYHLLKEDLITQKDKVWVERGQKIGLIGSTGKSSGAHIHFMVVQDKNRDGDFEDNIPDGITDPFGWQSKEVDPWENYQFFYKGKNRTGNSSYYLWKNKLVNLDGRLTANGGVFKTERHVLDFPAGATNQDLNINVKASPSTKISDSLVSIGSGIIATAKDTFGNIVTQFNSLYTITTDFKIFDLSRYKQDTISFYSSPDGASWTKEPTTVDSNNKVASTHVNHMTYFALMAERIDTTPPKTVATLDGQQGQTGWFRSDVTANLEAEDNVGGLGVDYVLYKLEDKDWEVYTSPLIFTSEGSYKIQFYSVDNDENTEDIKTIEFNIDKTIPEVFIDATPKIIWPPNGKMVEVLITGGVFDKHLDSQKINVDDEYNIVKPDISGFGQVIKLEAKRDGSDINGRMYIIKVEAEDLAGNKKEEQVEIIVPHDRGKN